MLLKFSDHVYQNIGINISVYYSKFMHFFIFRRISFTMSLRDITALICRLRDLDDIGIN